MDRFAELSAFVRTVERGSQTAAARDLGVTPAMVGRYVQSLEDRLGTRLLHRTTQRQSLTEAGMAFYPRALAVLEQLEAAEQVAAAGQAEPRGVLRVNGPMAFGVRHLAAAVAAFCELHPQLSVDLALNDRVVDLVEEGFDVALRIGRLADSSLVARRLAACRVLACAAPAYLARHGTPRRPEDLRGHNCLIYAYARHGRVRVFHGPHGAVELRLSGSITANSGEALLAAALAGHGIVIEPTFIVGEALREGRLVRLLPDWRFEELALHAVYPSARHLSPKVRSFVDFLVARFRDPPPWERDLE
ncbi:LysR family transcriptional regulator [Rhodovastum atsumiense]|uniref:LysR family transcriptional regulator n=1 Tax=Rhodovastum atsumiense TaxID=504468 RepID=A0A5M6IPH0_9PROT|nr:LysR family transcriptional regulator [Rhodovastum atsumiense]KAA5609468.1 LysR family transcriptional regulator [Rhodovastum atsumiense]CAH2603554.1 LysR family transcriptional regulator [Rhodovastum atsumiense]